MPKFADGLKAELSNGATVAVLPTTDGESYGLAFTIPVSENYDAGTSDEDVLKKQRECCIFLKEGNIVTRFTLGKEATVNLAGILIELLNKSTEGNTNV